MKNTHLVFALILAWVGTIAWSFLASSAIDGPRNIDTGFQRLDVFVRWQMLAFGLAAAFLDC